MKKILAKLTVIAGVLLAFTVSAQIQYSNEFWISTNATGNIYPNGGTLDSPLDGSTEATFDTNMYALPPNSVIHLLPGLFQTEPSWSYGGWVKTGDKIIGSGIDVTVVQCLSTTHDNLPVIVNYNFASCFNVEISDLTVDANSVPPSVGHHGVSIEGSENAIRRVKVINNYGTEEIIAIALQNFYLPDSKGNIIEDCVVSNYLGGTVDGIGLGGGSPTNMISGIIRNNRVYFPVVENLSVYPMSDAFMYNTLIEGNYLSGGQVDIHCDTGGFNNTIIAHNFLENCLNAIAPYTVGTNEDHITIAFNDIDLIWTNNYNSVAFNFWGGTQSDIKIFGNTIQVSGSGSSGAYIMTANDITGLEFANNSVDSLLASNQETTAYFINYTNLNMYNNYDLFGNYLPSLNIPTLGGVEVSTFGLDLVSSANASSALTNLGLPSNPDFAQYSDPAPTFTNGMNIGAETAYQIGGNDILWCSNSPGVGFDLILGLEPAGVVPIGLGNLLEGAYMLPYATNAYYNTIIGSSAGRFLLSSQNNTLVGADAGQALQYGNDNTFVGFNSGFGNGSFTNGYQNTLIGDQSLYRARSGTNNVALGYMAGSWLYSGNNNVFIAHEGTSAETNSNGTIYIGDPGVQSTTYIAGTVYSGNGFIGNSLVATNGFQCATNYVPSTWTPVPGSVILRASNDWMYAITMHSTNAAFKIAP